MFETETSINGNCFEDMQSNCSDQVDENQILDLQQVSVLVQTTGQRAPAESPHSSAHLGPVQSGGDVRDRWVMHGPQVPIKEVAEVSQPLTGQVLRIRGRVHRSRCLGALTFITLRKGMSFCQAIICKQQTPEAATLRKLVQSLSLESVVEVLGKVQASKATSSQASPGYELVVIQLAVVSRAEMPPFSVEQAALLSRSAALEWSEATGATHRDGVENRALSLPPRLRHDWRVLDLRAPENIALFRIQSLIAESFRGFFLKRRFVEIHSPKLRCAGKDKAFRDFRLFYFAQEARLAQSTQVYRQLAVQSGLGNVFEVGPVFRALAGDTHQHLCEFTSLDFEMELMESFRELIETTTELLRFIFSNVRLQCRLELRVFSESSPQSANDLVEDAVVSLSFEEARDLLKAAETHAALPLDDFSNAEMKRLAKLVREKHRTEVFVLHSLPDLCQPYTTMPQKSKAFACAFRVVLRGQVVASGAQHCHDISLLQTRAKSKGVCCDELYTSLRFGAVPQGGVQVGLERLTAGYLGLSNIRAASLFYRDSHRLTP